MTRVKQNLPKVSFIIPTLNAEEFLPRCLSAIRSQNYPKEKIEILVADGGSTDTTRSIAKKYKAIIIENPDILHEQGKSRASKKASGEILFYTDADNILSHNNWLQLMVAPYVDNKNVMAFLPQTVPAPDSNALDRYLGYLCTDPFTWFIYNGISSGRDFPKNYKPLETHKKYTLYRFYPVDPPLFGFSQGTGANKAFKRNEKSYADDLMAGIQLIEQKGIIAYVPAGVYHYHVSGIRNFTAKYRWRIKNNFSQKVKGMGLVNRLSYFSSKRRLRMYLFIPYAFSIILPVVDSIRLSVKYRDIVMLWHPICTVILAYMIVHEYIQMKFMHQKPLGAYE